MQILRESSIPTKPSWIKKLPHSSNTLYFVGIRTSAPTLEQGQKAALKDATLYAWAGKDTIPCLKLNSLLRFDLEEIEEWIKKSKHISDTLPSQIKPANSIDIDAVVKKAIDTAKRKKYNQTSGKPGRDQGLGKEA